jgi:hypothetical protein
MADPRNSNRGRSAVTAEDFARAYASQAHPVFPAHRQYFDESDEDDHHMLGADTDKDKEKKADSGSGGGDRSHELRRDEMQYRTALKTAFELGHKAGLMQRNEIPPCSACERRKERNRIAAQASRMEKRRLERGGESVPATSSASVETVVRAAKRRLPTAGVPPEPFHVSQAPAPSFSNASIFVHPPHNDLQVTRVEAEEEEEDEDEIEPPPFSLSVSLILNSQNTLKHFWYFTLRGFQGVIGVHYRQKW